MAGITPDLDDSAMKLDFAISIISYDTEPFSWFVVGCGQAALSVSCHARILQGART